MSLLKKILIFIAGLLTGWFPPEALVMLMEPPPGKGLGPRRSDPVPIARHPPAPAGPRHRRRRRPRVHRAPRRHDH